MADVFPPRAMRRVHERTIHGTLLEDPWHWLREQDDPAVRAHLAAENLYTDAVLAPAEVWHERFFAELKGRMMEDDVSAPVKDGPYWYYSRMAKGQQYPLQLRRSSQSAKAEEELLLDANRLARGKSYFDLGLCEASPDHRYVIYAVDTQGDESYTLRIKDLTTGKLLKDKISGSAADIEWASHAQGFYYVVLDEQYRPFKVLYHVLGQAIADDQVVYTENDRRFFVGLDQSEDRRFIFVASEGNNMSEWHYIDAAVAASTPKKLTLIEARSPEHEYEVSSHGEFFYILTNAEAPDYRLVRTLQSEPGQRSWQDVIPHEAGRLREGFCLFADYLVLQEKHLAKPAILIRHLKTQAERRLAFGDEPCELTVSAGREFEATTLRYAFTSLRQPYRIYDFDMASGEQTLVKEQKVPDAKFSAEDYASVMVWAPANDGSRIPVSLLYRKDRPADAPPAPVYLYAYGAYGFSMEAGFAMKELSLVDRGFIYAIAHVRGGMELGRAWYEGGKLLQKANSFTDFIAVADYLVQEGYTAPGQIVASGGSAGGMLVGAVANLRPELFKAVVAHVPFVDVLNTMLDDTLPLTAAEYNEWGNPQAEAYFNAIKAYSPYDNVRSQAYPAMYVTAGFSDPRVTYWEPAKWVQKLRALGTGAAPIVLRLHFEAGHLGASGRYDSLREAAEELAFIVQVFGLPS